jgi:hypothetical protein
MDFAFVILYASTDINKNGQQNDINLNYLGSFGEFWFYVCIFIMSLLRDLYLPKKILEHWNIGTLDLDIQLFWWGKKVILFNA